jgi:hypothetical protein
VKVTFYPRQMLNLSPKYLNTFIAILVLIAAINLYRNSSICASLDEYANVAISVKIYAKPKANHLNLQGSKTHCRDNNTEAINTFQIQPMNKGNLHNSGSIARHRFRDSSDIKRREEIIDPAIIE